MPDLGQSCDDVRDPGVGTAQDDGMSPWEVVNAGS